MTTTGAKPQGATDEASAALAVRAIGECGSAVVVADGAALSGGTG